jgi:hypothetical protein
MHHISEAVRMAMRRPVSCRTNALLDITASGQADSMGGSELTLEEFRAPFESE